jgi:uncharacterized protein YndB with AHSA1/START domain
VTADPGFAVEVEHRVSGSPETVFAYFTDPVKHRRWMGAQVELDARPGGIYRVAMAPARSSASATSGCRRMKRAGRMVAGGTAISPSSVPSCKAAIRERPPS